MIRRMVIVCLAISLVVPTGVAWAQSYAPIEQMDRTTCETIAQLLQNGIGGYGDNLSNLRYENEKCMFTANLPEYCFDLASQAGYPDPHQLTPEEWALVNTGCTNPWDVIFTVVQDYLGSCWAEYYNSGATVKWLNYDCRGATLGGRGVEFGDRYTCTTTGQDCVLTTDHKSELEAAGVIFSRDATAPFDHAAWDAFIASARIGPVNYLALPYILSGMESVNIDIKPGSDPNCLNINGHGVIPVAILGDNDFDVNQIDVTTISLAGLEVRVRSNKGPLCSIEYSNDDAYPDLVCHFEDDPGNWIAASDTATLIGNLLDGTPFEGTDSICVVP